MQYAPHNLYPTKINICPPPEDFDTVTLATNVFVNKQKLEIQRQKSKGNFDPETFAYLNQSKLLKCTTRMKTRGFC